MVTEQPTEQQILGELSSLIEDQLQVVTYKSLAKRCNIPFDVSKQYLYKYVSENAESSDATYFLSGFLHGTDAKHVIKVVDSNCLEHEKLGFENLTSIHVYSVQPRSLATLENLYDTDMIDCRENNARGGLSRVVAAQSDAEAPRKVATSGSTAHHPIHKSPCAKKLPVVTKHSPPKEGKEVAKKSQGPSGQKRKQQVIDSDDDSIDDMGEKTTAEAPEQVPDEGGETSHPPVASEKRYKTFINDNGEEVTELVPIGNPTHGGNGHKETKAPAALATRDNKSSSCMEHKKRPKEQRSIASFFNKK